MSRNIRWAYFVLSLISGIVIYNEISKPVYPDKCFISKFPLIRQLDQISCGPVAVTMLLNFYGEEVKVSEVKNKTKTKWFSYKGEEVGMTSPDYVAEALSRYGVYSVVRKSDLDHVKLYVSENRPPICLVRSSNTTWHYVIVVGYNDEDKTISLADPADGAIIMMSQHAFVEAWSFNCDMFGRKILNDCPVCGGDGKFDYWFLLHPLDVCDICAGSGTFPDFIGVLLRMADVSNYTLIVPMHANSFGG